MKNKKTLRLCLDFSNLKELQTWHKTAVGAGMIPDSILVPATPADIKVVVETIPDLYVLKKKAPVAPAESKT